VAAQRVETSGGGIAVRLGNGTTVTAQRLLVATGRRADPAAVGLPAVGVDPSARVAPVDDRCRVTDDGVWAVGDVTGKGAFTHVAMYQAGVVIRDILGEPGPPATYHALPRVTFTDPEVGAVGLTEAQARDRLAAVRVGTAGDPSDSVADGDLAGRVRQAIGKLPLEQREALELAYFGGCTFREVAARLDIPEGTAKSRLRLALRKLASMLGPEVAPV